MSYVAIFSSVTSMVINRERKNNLKSISSLVFTQAWSCIRYVMRRNERHDDSLLCLSLLQSIYLSP
jgi:hypothetical protein